MAEVNINLPPFEQSWSACCKVCYQISSPSCPRQIASKNKTVFYIQLPILPAYNFVANKIQEQSLQHALADLSSAKGTRALYVMIIILRAICLDNLAILCWFLSRNVDRRLSEEYVEEFDQLKNTM